MQSLKIESGVVRLAINDDPDRVIEFDPTDIEFAERCEQLFRDIRAKQKELIDRDNALKEAAVVDELGLPDNAGEQLKLVREVFSYYREQIDALFGAGTSQAAFGDKNSFKMIESFFNGITPIISNQRQEVIERRVNKRNKKAFS